MANIVEAKPSAIFVTRPSPRAVYFIQTKQQCFKCFIVGASLSEPHTSEKLGTVVTYTNNYEKKRTFSIFGWYGRFTYTNNSDEKRTNSIFGWYDCSCRKR